MKLMLLIVALIAFGLNVRAEEPKPALPAAAAVQADWPQIFRDLQEKDLVVREAAVKAFANALTEAAQASQKIYFENFKKSLAANDAKVREECVKQAVTVGLMFQNDKHRFPELLKDLTTGEPAQRAMREGQIFKAAEAVLQADHARGLIEKLGADDPQAQAQAVEALKAMKGDAAEELANGLDDEKASVKKLCAEMLRDLGPDGKEAVSALVFKLRDEDDKLGRKLASQALEQLGPAAANLNNPGAHGFSEILYAYTSATGNNGSAFAELNANTHWFNSSLGLAMFIGRFIMLIPMLAIAGNLAGKKSIPATAGTFPVTTPLFTVLLTGVIVIVGALTFFPVLALGPVLEHLLLRAGQSF